MALKPRELLWNEVNLKQKTMSINLLEMLNSQLGSSVIQQASKFLGEDEAKTQSAMGAILPSILGSLVQKSATPNGPSEIMDMVSKGNFDGSIFNNIGSMFGGGESSSTMMNIGTSLLKGLVGNKLGTLIDVVASVSGLKKNSSSSLLSMAAPLVMGMIGKVIKSKGLNAAGLAKMLLGQTKFIKDALPTEISNAMGFANLGEGMTERVTNTAKAVGNTVTDTTETAAAAGGGMMRKLISWGIPILLVLGGLYFVRGCGDNPISNAAGGVLDAAGDVTTNVADATKDAAGKVADVTKDAAGTVADATKDAAGAAADMAGEAADAVGDAASAAFDKMKAGAKKALEGVNFVAGSVGERFANLLGGDEDPVGKSFSFSNLTFASGSSNIDGSSKVEVENLAKVLNAYSTIKVEIQGHTDNTGDAAKNKTLSQARADAVKAMLMNLGVSGDRISTKGYGSENPTASNDTPEGRKQNRRIEVKVTAK